METLVFKDGSFTPTRNKLTTARPIMLWPDGRADFLALQYACLSAQTVITGWREKKIYWIYEGFDTWDTKEDGFDCPPKRQLSFLAF